MKYPDHITVFHKLAHEPKKDLDSLYFDVVVLSEKHQRIAARLFEDVALYDYPKAKRVTLASLPFLSDALTEQWRRQKDAQKKWTEAAAELSEIAAAL